MRDFALDVSACNRSVLLMLKLCDLLSLAKVDLGHFKIHCATGWSNPPLIAYFDGKFQQWQEYQNRKNFECDKVISLIHWRSDKWLFVGVWQILGVTPKTDSIKSWFEYSTSEIPGLDHLAGKTIISFKRTFRASYLVGKRYADQLVVSQLLSERMSIGDFPGYSSVQLSYDQLRHVVTHTRESWWAALKSVSGVYLILDTSCGKHYVGSAYGVEGIWGRWCLYATAAHGNNTELRMLLRERGDDHAKYFQFSILEICDVMATREEVLSRESHWKLALGSRKFGYNSN